MAYEKILAAYDGSDASKQAVLSAIELAELGAARAVLVLKVLTPYRTTGIIGEPMAFATGSPYFSIEGEERTEFQEEIAELASGHEELVETSLVLGQPREAILEVAAASKAGLIVMGSRGLGPVRSLLGSVSYGVLSHAEIPVLIVR